MWERSFCYDGVMRLISLISATRGLVPAEEKNDPYSLFVDVKNNLKHTTRTVENALQMACKSLCAEIAHETTISILNKFSSYYFWDDDAVLAAFEVFPLNYKYFLAPAQFHSLRQVIESVEIPIHVPAVTSLKHLHFQKYKEKMSEINKVINYVLDFSESLFELKKLSTNDYIKDNKRNWYVMDNISLSVYWIIITVVACTTQMCCLTSEKVTTHDLSRLAYKISCWLPDLKKCIHDVQCQIERKKAKRKLKELLQTPDEIVEVMKGLIFAKDDKQSLFDGSTKEMVRIDVLKKNNLLLFISSLNISSYVISTLIPIYIGIRKKKDKFKIVWIPIVEKWTDDLQIKFEMLQSDMPWYIVQYFSPVAGIKFIKEEWHFDNEPIVVVMNSQGDVKNKDALNSIRRFGMDAFPFNTYTFIIGIKLVFEMACKVLCDEIAHETTISILKELSSYSWEIKAVLALVAFALNYKYFSVLAQLDSSRKVIESVEIPKHVPATSLKHLHLQKYKEKIIQLINYVLDFSESVLELKKLSTNHYIKDKPHSYVMDNISMAVYWIIITVVACTTQMCCLTSEKDKIHDLSRLANKIKDWLSRLEDCIAGVQSRIERKKAERKLKELLQTPDEIVEVLKGLIFAKDDKQSLFDGSTKEMVSIDVLKNKNVLLFISSLNISNDDISILIPIDIGIRKEEDKFKIVWIPIMEQWTNDMRKKFEMLRSDMPWYVVQYFSPVAGIKFMKEEWHFDNEPIVVVMNSRGDVKNKDGLDSIRRFGMNAFPFATCFAIQASGACFNPRGPHEIETCTFYCGGKDKIWIEQFSQKFNAVAEDPLIVEAEKIFIALFCVGIDCKLQHFDEDIQEILRPFKKERRWAAFINGFNEVISNDEAAIVTFLERFGQWKGNVRRRRRIETCFKDLLQTGSLPSTSTNV
ncbi:hypothetical protein FH972_004435 [Carpinus fangiana]|uniref:Sieve element occlusion N-terminal domain-containing protein n=1 Tax=Carpinus fangiana TaxID=176857 RepID=A0A5N6QLJ5_9ROSI|nr:hypothetical protein FH972_004435 [Carpinus fangiana]